MKFIVSSTALFGRIQAISKVINSKNALPILDSFLFEIENNTLTITASDIETRMVTSLEIIESESDFRFCINAKTILDSMKEISEQPLTFDINTETMEIQAQYQNGRFSIMGQNANDYPDALPAPDANILTLSAESLLKGINYCFFATADDELRPIMNGIYVDISPEDVTFVSSDGQKLVRNKVLNAHGDNKCAFILPKKPASLLKSILPKESGDIEIRFSTSQAVVIMNDYTLTCRLIEGRYPNYNMVIPQNNPYSAIIDRLHLLGALKRVLIFSNQSSSLVKLILENNTLTVSGQDLDFSTSAEEKIACSYSGNTFKIAFNGTYLYDILNNLNCTDVTIELADPSRAGVVVPTEQAENENTLMLLVPLMLNE